MAGFLFEGKQIYYEEHGTGEPLLVLNGIFMSCASWAQFVPSFKNRCKLILLDLLDQGKTEKMDVEYTLALQVELVEALRKHLGYESWSIVGISYGGEVAQNYAVKYAQRVKKLVLSNTAPNTSNWLKEIGHSWEYACNSHDGHQFFKTCIPIVYSPQFFEKNYAWASAREDLFVRAFTPAVYDAFSRLIRSAETHDVRKDLGCIMAETLVISSEFDYVTPLYQQKEIIEGIKGSSHILIPDAGHAVMYEKPSEFASAVLGFVTSETKIRVL